MIQIKFYGIGGQGVVTAAKILATAVALYEEKYAITLPAYGHERRGAPVFTDMVIDKEPVKSNCFVYKPDLVVMLDDTIIDRHKHVDVSKGMHENTILLINSATREKVCRYRDAYGFKEVFFVDATGIALKNIGRGIPNGAMLGALAKAGMVKIESVEAALKEFFAKAGDKNASAAREAYETTQKL